MRLDEGLPPDTSLRQAREYSDRRDDVGCAIADRYRAGGPPLERIGSPGVPKMGGNRLA
jgi:hypothetical protein